MVAENDLKALVALPVEDRITIIARLQESLDEDSFTLTPELEAELRRRVADDDANPGEGYTLEEVEAMMAARRRK